MKLRRVLACLTAMVFMFSGIDAMAEILSLPTGLETIQTEAFSNIKSAKRIIIPEGTKRIESRAFAGSIVSEIYLPEYVEYIAPDAFAECDSLRVYAPRNSQSHIWLNEHGVRYGVLDTDVPDEDAQFVIHSVEFVSEIDADANASQYFLAKLDAPQGCTLEIRLLDEENRAQLLGVAADVAAGLKGGKVKAGEEETLILPQYYVLEATLIRNGIQVGETYTDSRNTARHERICGKTADDYSGTVISFGDAGYGVLDEDVRTISGAVEADGVYIVRAEAEIRRGDVLMLEIDGKNTPVKVAAVQKNADGSQRIEPDSDINMEDVYQRLKISGYMQPVNGASTVSSDDSNLKIIPLDPSFKSGVLKVEGKIEIGVKIDIDFDRKEDYLFAECWVSQKGTVEATALADYDSSEKGALRIPFQTVGVTIPNTDIEAILQVSLPFNLKVEAGVGAHIEFNSKAGFSYNSDDKQFIEIDEDESQQCLIISEDAAEAYAETKAKIEVSAGPEIRLSAQLMDFLDAEIRGQVGVKAVGELEGLQYGGSISSEGEPDSIHACDGCVDVDISLFAGVYGKLKCSALKKIEVNFFDEALFEAEEKIGDAYCSFLNKPKSPYGGKPSWGIGECENVQYRAAIEAVDYSGDNVSVPVVCTGVYGEVQKATTDCTMYLYPGNNAFAASFDSGDQRETKWMQEEPAELVIQEKPITLQVTAMDNSSEKPISAAAVTVTLPDGSTRTGSTNSNGVCSFGELPGGEYSIKVSKNNYKTSSVSRLKFTPGMNVNHKAGLIYNGKLGYVYAEYVTKTEGWRKLGDDWHINGNMDLSEMPKAYIKVEEDGKGNAIISLRYDRCKEDIQIKLSRAECVMANVNARDLGNGEYSFHIGAEYHSYTSNHSTHYGSWSYFEADVITKGGKFVRK